MKGSKDKQPDRQVRTGPKSTKSNTVPNTSANTTAQSGNTEPTAQAPPPGLDEARHAAAQRAAHGAEGLRQGVFPALMATALNLDRFFDANAYKIYLANVLRDLGEPADPLEQLLVEQACLLHFRAAQVHASAGQANGLEATRLLNAAAARLVGELRRTVLSVKAYRSATPAKSEKARVRLFKAAQ